jgi:ParB family transcriptional regulator, chromosome partitioning protein
MARAEKQKAKVAANIAESLGPQRNGSTPHPVPAADPKWKGVDRVKAVVRDVPLGLIEPDPEQPRRSFDPAALDELAASLKRDGQLQPCKAWWCEGRKTWVLVWGERRFRAAKIAGLAKLRVEVLEAPPERRDRLRWQLAENAHRQDVPPLELAAAVREYVDLTGLSPRKAAEELGMSHSAVARLLDLVELPKPVRELVASGTLPASTAVEVGRLATAREQISLAFRARDERLSRDEVAEMVRRMLGRKKPEPAPAPIEDPVCHGDTPPPSVPIPPPAGSVRGERPALAPVPSVAGGPIRQAAETAGRVLGDPSAWRGMLARDAAPSLFAVVPDKARRGPAYFVKADDRDQAEAHVRGQHPAGYKFHLDPIRPQDLPAICVVQDARPEPSPEVQAEEDLDPPPSASLLNHPALTGRGAETPAGPIAFDELCGSYIIAVGDGCEVAVTYEFVGRTGRTVRAGKPSPAELLRRALALAEAHPIDWPPEEE